MNLIFEKLFDMISMIVCYDNAIMSVKSYYQ